MKARIIAVLLLILGAGAGYFVYPFSGIWVPLDFPFRLGLDLQGGINLIYRADADLVSGGGRDDALEGLRDVIERRVNLFGVSEPRVRLQNTLGEDHLNVELAGVFDIEEAIRLIGETPYLEFRELADDLPEEEGTSTVPVGEVFLPTELTGRFLESAQLQFDHTVGSASIGITFDDEGAILFEKITERNVGRPLAIYLDGAPISIPTVQSAISGGQAQITGDFTPEEARLLAQRLNSGALPVPIELISQSKVEPSLGEESLRRSFIAGVMGLLFVVIFMLFWYRLPGLVSVIALGIYISVALSVFKLIPVTFTTAGIAGFVLSIGMAVDANILIFERMREELKRGRSLVASIEDGFLRAWTSVRDSNTSSLITALILWYFGTDAVRGFALTLGIGVIISMFSALFVTRTLLRAISVQSLEGRPWLRLLYNSGITKFAA